MGGGGNGTEVGRAGGWAGVGGEGRKLYLNTNKIKKKKKKKKALDSKSPSLLSEVKCSNVDSWTPCSNVLNFINDMF